MKLELIEKEQPTKEPQDVMFRLYERASERCSKMAGIVGMLKANLSTLVMYNEVTPEGKNRAKAALLDLEREWDAMMSTKTDADHETE